MLLATYKHGKENKVSFILLLLLSQVNCHPFTLNAAHFAIMLAFPKSTGQQVVTCQSCNKYFHIFLRSISKTLDDSVIYSGNALEFSILPDVA